LPTLLANIIMGTSYSPLYICLLSPVHVFMTSHWPNFYIKIHFSPLTVNLPADLFQRLWKKLAVFYEILDFVLLRYPVSLRHSVEYERHFSVVLIFLIHNFRYCISVLNNLILHVTQHLTLAKIVTCHDVTMQLSFLLSTILIRVISQGSNWKQLRLK
jgi:hypothetical protein